MRSIKLVKYIIALVLILIFVYSFGPKDALILNLNTSDVVNKDNDLMVQETFKYKPKIPHTQLNISKKVNKDSFDEEVAEFLEENQSRKALIRYIS